MSHYILVHSAWGMVLLDLDGLFIYLTDLTDNFGGNSAGMRRRT